MKELIQKMREEMKTVSENIDKNTKAAEARTRKATLALDKLNKQYRKLSISQHK